LIKENKKLMAFNFTKQVDLNPEGAKDLAMN
jgi:hypothetical protein